MGALRAHIESIKRDQRGFTLPELLTTIAILGILLAIAIIIWLGLLERWRVEAAAHQIAADMRLAHSSASNQLTDWRMVLDPGKTDENRGADYRLAKLSGVYKSTYATPTVDGAPSPRTLPANVKIVNISGALDPVATQTWMVSPTVGGQTRTLEFNSDGTMHWYQAASASTCVTVDGNPQIKVTALAATSRVEIKDGTGTPCD